MRIITRGVGSMHRSSESGVRPGPTALSDRPEPQRTTTCMQGNPFIAIWCGAVGWALGRSMRSSRRGQSFARFFAAGSVRFSQVLRGMRSPSRRGGGSLRE